MHIDGHALVRRVVVHVTHHHDLDPGIFIHQFGGVLVDDFRATAPKVAPLASDPGWKVGDEEREHLALDLAPDHQHITGAKVSLRLLVHVELYVLTVEIKRNGFAFNQFELLRPVKQGHIDASPVRTVIVHDLVVRVGDLLLAHKILKHMAVLNLAQAQNRVESLVLVSHRLDHRGDVAELAVVPRVSPAVCPVGEIFIVILALVVVGVEEVLDIVEADDIPPRALVPLGAGRGGHNQKQQSGIKYFSQTHISLVLLFMNMSVPPGRYLHHQATLFGSSASILAATSSPTFAGRFTKKSIPNFSSRSSTDIE